MSLLAKLAAALSAFLLLMLTATWIWTYHSVESRMERERDANLKNKIVALAAVCGEAWGPQLEKSCLEALYHRLSLDQPSAFSYALVTDGQFKIMLHSQFLRHDFSKRGTELADEDIRGAADNGSFLIYKNGLRIYGEPMNSQGTKVGMLVAAFNEEALRSSLAWLRTEMEPRLAMACLVGALVSILLSLALAYYLLSPLDAIAETAYKVGRGDLKSRAPEGRRDEIGMLAAEVNRMIGGLAELDELKDSFVAKVTHDLKTPLSAIEAEISNLLAGYKGPLSPVQSEELKLVQENSRMLTDLINHILEVTKLEAGHAAFKKEELDAASEIQSAIDLLQAKAQEFGVELVPQLDPGLPIIYADGEAFRRLLMNLVANALKFTPKGGRITVKAARSEAGEALVAVLDTGIGIPKDRIGTLFKKFSQVPETRNKVRETGGSGLGLLICKDLVEAHGGRIWIESELFRGTTISFTLPAKPATPVEG